MQKIFIDYSSFSSELEIMDLEGVPSVRCYLRNRMLVLLPEEHVRQLLILALVKQLGVSENKIAIEKKLEVNGMTRRFDLLIYDNNFNPLVLVECKAPAIKIGQDTFDQIARYNLYIKAPYLLVTNGIDTYFCEYDTVKNAYKALTLENWATIMTENKSS